MTRTIHLLKVGRTLPPIAARRGDFERWFEAGLGRPVEVIDATVASPLPPPAHVGALVVTGSAAMVSAREPWSVRAGFWLADVVAAGVPTLAVCYGHQLLADALGAPVGPNPRGRQIGTIEVQMTEAARKDPLFGEMPDTLVVQATHVEAVLALPDGAVRLGATTRDPNHVYRVGERAWCVQFHPEFDADVVRGYVDGRRPQLRAEGFDPEVLVTRRATRGTGPRFSRGSPIWRARKAWIERAVVATSADPLLRRCDLLSPVRAFFAPQVHPSGATC